MGHLSPFHYASESILLLYTLAFIVYRVWRIDNFQILTCRQLKETPGRVIAMYLIIVAAPIARSCAESPPLTTSAAAALPMMLRISRRTRRPSP